MENSYSVIIPLFNKEKHIERALDSATHALYYFNYEIIIVDDGSTDNSLINVKKYIKNNPFLPITIINQCNQGVSVARNVGVDNARQSYLLFLDADDEWDPGFVCIIDSLINRFPQALVFATAHARSWTSGESYAPTYSFVPTDDRGGILQRYFFSRATGAEPVWTSAVCFERTFYQKIGGFPPEISHGEDKILWARAAIQTNIAWSPYIGAYRYIDADNRSDKQFNPSVLSPYAKELDVLLTKNWIDEVTKSDLRMDRKKEIRMMLRRMISNSYIKDGLIFAFSERKKCGYYFLSRQLLRCFIPNWCFSFRDKIKILF